MLVLPAKPNDIHVLLIISEDAFALHHTPPESVKFFLYPLAYPCLLLVLNFSLLQIHLDIIPFPSPQDIYRGLVTLVSA